jgi:hypothetical protein
MVSLWPGPVKTEFMQENVINSGGHFFLRSSKKTQRGKEHKLGKHSEVGCLCLREQNRRKQQKEKELLGQERKRVERARERE